MLMALYNVSISVKGLKHISESPEIIPVIWTLLDGKDALRRRRYNPVVLLFLSEVRGHKNQWVFDLDRWRLGSVSPYSPSPAVNAGGRGGVAPAGLLSAGSRPTDTCGTAYRCW